MAAHVVVQCDRARLLEIWRPFESLSDAGVQRPFLPHPEPPPIANMTFEDGAGRRLTLADFRGKIVLLNIWAIFERSLPAAWKRREIAHVRHV